MMSFCRECGMFLHFVAHPVDLLDVGEDHLGVHPGVSDHGVHVLRRQEVGNAGVPFSGFECDFVILFSVFWVDFGKVEGLWEKVVDEGTEGNTALPGFGEVFDFHSLVFPDPALAPNEDGLHLW